MWILDITNLKFADVEMFGSPCGFSRNQHKKPAAISSHPKPTKKLQAQSASTRIVYFSNLPTSDFMNKILQVEYQVSHIHSIHWWFLPSFYSHCFAVEVGFHSFNSMVMFTIFFLDSYFFSLLNRWVGGDSQKKKVEDWKSKGGFENC